MTTLRRHGELFCAALMCAALAAAAAAIWAGNRTECDENGWRALVVMALGAAAVFGAPWVVGARLRWSFVLAIAYTLGVYAYLAANAIGNCTA